MRELTIIDIFDIFLDNIKIILIAVIIGIILSIIYTKFILVPMYESSTKIILVKPTTETTSSLQTINSGLTANDVALNQKLVSTYSEIIKSRKVIDEVIATLKLDITSNTIAKNITISPVKDSEVINVKVTNKNANTASDIANELIVSFGKQVKEIYKIENVNQVDKAIPSEVPNNVNLLSNIALFAILAAILSFGICVSIQYFRITLKSPEEIEEIAGVQLLAIIPDLDRKVER
jgi:capsular polysaccharide biosynthesis protein